MVEQPGSGDLLNQFWLFTGTLPIYNLFGMAEDASGDKKAALPIFPDEDPTYVQARVRPERRCRFGLLIGPPTRSRGVEVS